MIISRQLSLNDQNSSRKYWHVFNMMNAASFVCVADNILFLFALDSGCPKYLIPLIASFMYIGFIAMPLGKILTAKIGATSTISFFWMLRNISGLVTASAPLISVWVAPWAGIATILVGAFCFYCSRSAGVVAINPVFGEITTPHDRGKFTTTTSRNFNLIGLVGLMVISFIMKEYPSRTTFQLIIVFGSVTGLISAYVVTRIKESPVPRESAATPVLKTFNKALQNGLGKKLTLANAAVLSGIVIVLPVSMTALKVGYEVSDSTALVFALVQFLGGIVISTLSGVVANQSGPRPLILIAFSLLLVSSLLWIMAPAEFEWIYVFWIFLLNGAAAMGAPMALTHYFLNVIPSKERIGYTLFISLIAGPAAGLCSFIVGSGLLKLLPAAGLSGINLYKTYFAIILVLLFIFLFILMMLDKLTDWEVKKLLGLAFTPRDMRALLLLNKMEKTGNPAQEIENIEKLSNTHSAISADKILDYLETPKFLVRIKAIMALREIPFEDKVKEKLIEELEYGTHTTAPIATMILGERGVKEAIPVLRKNLESDNIYLQGRTMVALATLHDLQSFDRIKSLFITSENQFVIISGAAAMTIIADPKSLELLLKKTLQNNLDRSIRAEIYSAIADVCGIGDEFYKLFKLYFTRKELRGSLCVSFLETIRDDKPISTDATHLINKFNDGRDEAECLLKFMIDITSSSSRKRLSIIHDFLTLTPPGEIREILIYCLLGICRKNGKI